MKGEEIFDNNFYVYFLIDSQNQEVFYIGKGRDGRLESHFTEFNRYKKLIFNKIPTIKGKFSNHSKLERMNHIEKNGFKIIGKKVKENLCEESAFVLEEMLIERFGRKCFSTGKLTNLLPGGDWEYEKLVLKESEKTTIKDVERNYPELLNILDKFPIIRIKRDFSWYHNEKKE